MWITKTVNLAWHSTNLQGKQIRMYCLDMVPWQFVNTSEDKFQDQWALIQLIWYTQVDNQQKKAWTNKLREILDQENQSIEENNSEHPTGTTLRPSENLRGDKIRMSGLDTAHRNIC